MSNNVGNARFNLSELSFLIVDDDPVILELTTRILSSAGTTNILTAHNGIEALQRLAASKIPCDVIICDLSMPGMNGVEFLEHLSGINYAGGVLLLSEKDNRLLETVSELARVHRLNVIGTVSKADLSMEMIRKIVQNYVPFHVSTRGDVPPVISEAELRDGLTGSALDIYYQPKINIKNDIINGVEVLARWKHPSEGILPPSSFIQVAETSGLINELTFSVYEKAVNQIRLWQESSLYLNFSINISVNSLIDPDFYHFIVNCLKEKNLDPGIVILEITEREIMTNLTQSLASLMNLRMQNFRLSIDDFGTGYSSMEKLKMIPFTELKLDRSFVTDAANRPSAQVILESSVELGRKLNMEIVAEGVETQSDLDFVSELDCDYVQGFYYARPMPAEELYKFYKTRSKPN